MIKKRQAYSHPLYDNGLPLVLDSILLYNTKQNDKIA